MERLGVWLSLFTLVETGPASLAALPGEHCQPYPPGKKRGNSHFPLLQQPLRLLMWQKQLQRVLRMAVIPGFPLPWLNCVVLT